MHCSCDIVPKDVLDRLANDKQLSAETRKALSDTSLVSDEIRKLRVQTGAFTTAVQVIGAHFVELAALPIVTVYDCRQTQTLPGAPVAVPETSTDPTAKRTFDETSRVAEFYKKIFDRNSIDDAGMTMMSSIHFGVKYNNAMWNGTQMLYGDGDGQLFIDFTNGSDVIGHELTHGVTQNTLQLAYYDDAGGLNESLSDCFGSMFFQWEADQDVNSADWLIGSGIMGPTAKARGFTSLRSMAHPADTHCLAPQPTHYSQIHPGMDPHYTSGPPNLAFCLACKAAGGKSWEKIGQVWYTAMTDSGRHPNMKMADFAHRTRQVASQKFSVDTSVMSAVDKGWKQVGL
jgi:Zn-dependent metalloprotease